MQTDEELVMSIRAGDRAAFDVLYARYSARLFGYLLRIVKDRALAEDIFQDAFMEVLENRVFELQERRFGGWLFTVARNRALTQLRSTNRRTSALEDFARNETSTARVSAEESTDQSHRLAALSSVLSTLSEPHHDALLLKEVGGLTYREIAEIQQVPEGTAKSRLHFAIKAVRRALAGKGVDDDL